LFSNHYLDKLLPGEKEWGIETSFYFKEIKALYETNKERLPGLNESQLRKHFLDKVLEILGWTVDVEPPTPSGEWAKHPDYALFKDKENLRSAQSLSQEGYFSKAACIGEAKQWGRPLDRKLKSEADPFEVQNPSLQISRYLWLSGVQWGVLTDGKYWRLYERETSKRLDIYYEIDLPSLLEDGTEGDFKYFCLFFRKESFPEFVNKVYQGSVDYARVVGEELKGNVYQALKLIADGFLKTPGNGLSQEDLKDIHNNSLILLYRLLFVLYAECRDLLPLGKNQFYTESYSLDVLKKEVASKLDHGDSIALSTYQYWNKLKELFEVINSGNPELEVPPYNGGLFNPAKHKFLETCRAGDLYLARAIDFLTRSQDKAFIDYSSLEVRHLGSIYEGLLEYKLRIADQDLVSVKEKGKEIYVPLDEAEKKRKKIKEEEIVREGEAYLVTDKGERKASGSYYTPDYIVNYIIENTLRPLCDQITERIRAEIHKLEEKVKGSRGQNREVYQRKLEEIKTSFDDEVLKLKVLDPAMGSGHFLVRATEYLAEEVATNPYAWDEEAPEGEAAVSFYKRRIVENCIYGVDLNPLAVELTKLSLWLSTVAKNRPLNFLDHHLRCGNSLIGAKIEDLANLPDARKRQKKKEQPDQLGLGLFEDIFKERVFLLLGAFKQIEDLLSDTVEQIGQKEKLYQDFRRIVARFCDVADVWTSAYFGNEVGWKDYDQLQENLRAKEKEWQTLMASCSCFSKAKEIACDKHFFHWELEFPEVFFEGSRHKDNPGFDCVVGNPPYGDILDDTTKYFLEEVGFNSGGSGNNDVFRFFTEKGLYISNIGAYLGYIIPNTFLFDFPTALVFVQYFGVRSLPPMFWGV
ncbi:N-6 DNA methylase, partial [bacterium]|nr:N-6 DNA methylase [bacterium]